MNTDYEIEQIELSMEEARKEIGQMKAVLRLVENPDFKEIIDDGYFMKEAARLVILRADPSMADDRQQKAIDDQITAVGNFRQYLGSVMQRGRMAERALVEAEESRTELLTEAAYDE